MRATTARSAAGPAGRSTATACSSGSRSPRRDVERVDLAYNRSAHRARIALPGGSTVLAVVTHLHHLGPDEAIRDEQTRLLLEWLDDAPAADATILMGDFNADPAEPSPARLRAAGFRSAFAEANGAEPAVTWPSGLTAPAMDTDGEPECLDYIWLRGAARATSARLAFDRPDPEDPTIYPSDHLGHRRPARDRGGVGECRIERSGWRTAATGAGRPENSIAAFTAALAIPACDGLEFDVRASSDGIPVICHDATLERTHGRPERIDALSAAALEALGVPTLADVLATVGRRPFLDVELKEVLGPSVVELLAGARGPGLSNAVVSSFEVAALERIAHLAPAWPRWLNSHTLTAADIEAALGLGCRGDRRALAGARPAIRSRWPRAAGLEVASYTVRRRSTFDRLARLGVVAVCVEAGALDG